MSFFGFLLGVAFKLTGTFALLFGAACLFFFIGALYYPDYWFENAVDSTVGLAVFALVYDRLFGPTRTLLRDVGKSLAKARRKRRA